MQRDEILNRELEQFLTNYSDNEIRITYKRSGTFTGKITREGFDRLVNDPRVKEIRQEYTEIGYASSNDSIQENQSIANKTFSDQTITKPLTTNIRNNQTLYFSIVLIVLIILLIINLKKLKFKNAK